MRVYSTDRLNKLIEGLFPIRLKRQKKKERKKKKKKVYFVVVRLCTAAEYLSPGMLFT